MNKVARLSSSDRKALFNEAAAHMGVNSVIIEKDVTIHRKSYKNLKMLK